MFWPDPWFERATGCLQTVLFLTKKKRKRETVQLKYQEDIW